MPVRVSLGDESADVKEDAHAAQREFAISTESDDAFEPEPPVGNPWWSMNRDEQKQFATDRLRASLTAKRAEAERSLLSYSADPQQTLPN